MDLSSLRVPRRILPSLFFLKVSFPLGVWETARWASCTCATLAIACLCLTCTGGRIATPFFSVCQGWWPRIALDFISESTEVSWLNLISHYFVIGVCNIVRPLAALRLAPSIPPSPRFRTVIVGTDSAPVSRLDRGYFCPSDSVALWLPNTVTVH